MMTKANGGRGHAFDLDWEKEYQRGFSQNWPWDVVVSFVFRHAPRDRPRSDIRVLELGFGTGANLWFAAREGFAVAGVEGSETAVAAARARFAREGLAGDLRVGDFTGALPFADRTFDLVIDRAALSYTSFSKVRQALGESRRVLREGGVILFSPYASDHPAASSGRPIGDGLIDDITWVGLAGAGPVSFWTGADTVAAFGEGWDLFALSHVARTDHIGESGAFAAWYAMARKVGA